MTPAARVQSAIELLDAIIAAARNEGASADRLAGEWFRARRYAGSSDRRAIRDLVWQAIRACGEVPPSGRSALLRLASKDPQLASLFDDLPRGPTPIVPGEPVAAERYAPAWLMAELHNSGLDDAEIAAMLDRAPLDLRANRLRTTREELRRALPVAAEPTVAPDGLRLHEAAPVESWPQFQEGQFEVQDTGSQIACSALGASPGEKIVDLCAGAGGKALAIAAALENQGELLACDADRGRLSRLPQRAARAGALIETLLLDPGRELERLGEWRERADAVLVDAPCSGTGTWRRNPESRWRLTPQRLAATLTLQARLLDIAAALVRPGGRLLYVVCSVLDAEGPDQARAFIARQGGWCHLPVASPVGSERGFGYRLTPLSTRTDGFFFAAFQRL